MPDGQPVTLGPYLACHVTDVGDVAVVSLSGEFDLAAVDGVRALVTEIEATSPRALVFDLDGLTFLDSSGAASLIDVHHRSLGIRPFAVVRGVGPAYRALTMMGIDQLLTTISSIDELNEELPTERPEAGG